MTLLLAGMMLLGMVTVANATTTISTYIYSYFDSYNKTTVCCYGASGTATIGQTFRLSDEPENIGDNSLDSVTFLVKPTEGDIEFEFYLYEWDGSKITGGPLFEIESGQLSAVQKEDGFQEFTVDVGGVILNVDQDYVFFISVSDGYGNIAAMLYSDNPWFYLPTDPTPLHKLVYNVSDDFSLLSTTDWDTFSNIYTSADMAFEMVLSASGPGPEPEPEPGPEAAFELTRAKVDLKKGKIKVDGQVVLPEGFTCEDLVREGSVKLRLFELDGPVEAVDDAVVLVEAVVVDDLVELEVKGRNGEKWQFKNPHALGVTEYKVHWKDDQTGKVKIKADFDPGLVDLSQLTPKLVAEITLGELEFELTMAENGQYDCKLKRKKWDFRNKP